MNDTMNATLSTLALVVAGALPWPGVAFAQGKLAAGSDTPVAQGGPFDRVHHPENAPAAGDAEGFPREWRFAYANLERNAAYGATAEAPQWLKAGVSWSYAEARA